MTINESRSCDIVVSINISLIRLRFFLHLLDFDSFLSDGECIVHLLLFYNYYLFVY